MNLVESTRRYILLGIVVLVVVGIIVAKFLASNQDKQFALEDALYQQAAQLANEGNFSGASTIINQLLIKQSDYEAVNYLGGLVTANTGEMEKAVVLFQKTLDLNPYNVENPMFMLQFGEILVNAKRYDDARIVLSRCQESGWAPAEYPGYQEQVTALLSSIENL